ncbi:hypothetical protein GUJ93_ZPchr0006g43791 [Zizania palustris]|uniref:Uncharacterized protein n=1 Tax=Zizania palustris TaxID=103762 RepID=A0A8J5TC96_ZIZPA|nr:hypothetical protein GUJ93_ZPchr0006g43791 [Zizania palustris]
MEESFVPPRGIKHDINGRLVCYRQDWIRGFRVGIRILAPTTYMRMRFFFFLEVRDLRGGADFVACARNRIVDPNLNNLMH